MTAQRRSTLFAALLVAAACAPPSPGSGGARLVVGEPYSLGGVWSYPREDYGLSESGLATVLPDARRGRRTVNGEVHDPAGLFAAHRTLQLPAVLSVWNLDTGRELRVRVNDRGPLEPGRILGLSRRAAELLGVAQGVPAPVRIAVEPELSRAVAEGLPGAGEPRVAVAAAPVAAVEREQLAPLPGARAAAGARFEPVRTVPAPVEALGSGATSILVSPVRLAEDVRQRGVVPFRLMVDAGAFFRRDLADRRAAALRGAVAPSGAGRQPLFRVRLGPFATVGEADSALNAALRNGIPDAKIVLD